MKNARLPFRMPWQMILAAALVLLLAALATLQYRWLGDVSQAERERMRAGLRTRVADFSEAFDRELTRVYLAFHVDARALTADPAHTIADAFTGWQSAAAAPALVDAAYLIEGGAAQTLTLRRFDPARRTLDPADWPPLLTRLRERAEPSAALRDAPPFFMPDAVDASIPALIVALPNIASLVGGKRLEVLTKPETLTRAIVVVLNADQLRTQVLEPLVAKYFGDGSASEYLVTIVRRDDPARVVYTSDSKAAPLDERAADVTSSLFDLRLDEFTRLNPGDTFVHRGGIRANMAITIVRRAAGGGRGTGVAGMMAAGFDQGAWQARVRYRSGSLESVVAQSRRRNLAIGLGVLGLLAASFVLIIASAQRQQRLARQQIEFVAAVSHELRTPLAVIRSAGENLADGVVAGDDQVKRYGSLIEAEGRRLSDMVERVMEFAGIASGRTMRVRADVDLSRAIADAVQGLRAEARDRDVAVTVHVDGPMPHVIGDAEAIRSALENIIGNAIKYSPNGAAVEVRAAADGQQVRIAVVDRGIGIDAEDLPHVFKPFFRGRRAADAQIRGTGIGLSVVRHVVRAHHGRVRVESRPGEGTTVTVELPAPTVPEPNAAVESACDHASGREASASGGGAPRESN